MPRCAPEVHGGHADISLLCKTSNQQPPALGAMITALQLTFTKHQVVFCWLETSC